MFSVFMIIFIICHFHLITHSIYLFILTNIYLPLPLYNPPSLHSSSSFLHFGFCEDIHHRPFTHPSSFIIPPASLPCYPNNLQKWSTKRETESQSPRLPCLTTSLLIKKLIRRSLFIRRALHPPKLINTHSSHSSGFICQTSYSIIFISIHLCIPSFVAFFPSFSVVIPLASLSRCLTKTSTSPTAERPRE